MKTEYNIVNRNGLKVGAIAQAVESPKGTAIIHHGYPGSTNSPTVQLMRQTFNNLGFNTITPNTTHNYNGSDGDYREMTLAGHIDDLADCVIHTISGESFRRPFILAGHSAGGHSTLVTAAKLDNKYKPDLTIASAPLISGERYLEGWKTLLSNEGINVEIFLAQWISNGFIPCGSDSGPDELELRWSVMQEWCEHDLIRDKASPLTPTVIIGGEKDVFIPPLDLIDYFDAARIGRHDIEISFIKDGDHSYTGQEAEFAARIKNAVSLYLG